MPGRILVRFKEGVTESVKERILSGHGARVKNEISHIGVRILELPPNASEKAQAQAFRQHDEVEFAELDPVAQPATTPNDYWYFGQWHLSKINCPQAWDVTTG